MPTRNIVGGGPMYFGPTVILEGFMTMLCPWVKRKSIGKFMEIRPIIGCLLRMGKKFFGTNKRPD